MDWRWDWCTVRSCNSRTIAGAFVPHPGLLHLVATIVSVDRTCAGLSSNYYLLQQKIRSIAGSILGRNAGFHEIILESLNNIFTVQAYTMEDKEKEKFTDCTKQMQRLSLKMIFYNGLRKTIHRISRNRNGRNHCVCRFLSSREQQTHI